MYVQNWRERPITNHTRLLIEAKTQHVHEQILENGTQRRLMKNAHAPNICWNFCARHVHMNKSHQRDLHDGHDPSGRPPLRNVTLLYQLMSPPMIAPPPPDMTSSLMEWGTTEAVKGNSTGAVFTTRTTLPAP